MTTRCRRCGDEFDTHDNTRGDDLAVLCRPCVQDLERLDFKDEWLEAHRE